MQQQVKYIASMSAEADSPLWETKHQSKALKALKQSQSLFNIIHILTLMDLCTAVICNTPMNSTAYTKHHLQNSTVVSR